MHNHHLTGCNSGATKWKVCILPPLQVNRIFTKVALSDAGCCTRASEGDGTGVPVGTLVEIPEFKPWMRCWMYTTMELYGRTNSSLLLTEMRNDVMTCSCDWKTYSAE